MLRLQNTYSEEKGQDFSLWSTQSDSRPQSIKEVAPLGGVHLVDRDIRHVESQLTQCGEVRPYCSYQQHVTTARKEGSCCYFIRELRAICKIEIATFWHIYHIDLFFLCQDISIPRFSPFFFCFKIWFIDFIFFLQCCVNHFSSQNFLIC